MNFKANFFFHIYETHITPLGIPIPTVPGVSDGLGGSYENTSLFYNALQAKLG